MRPFAIALLVPAALPGGVCVTETADEARVVPLVRQHARRAVSEFVAEGMPRDASDAAAAGLRALDRRAAPGGRRVEVLLFRIEVRRATLTGGRLAMPWPAIRSVVRTRSGPTMGIA